MGFEHPITANDLLAESDHICRSDTFEGLRNSKRLLRYLIEACVNKLIPTNKTIAADVFNKPNIDPGDSQVRTEAFALRKHLAEYYEREGANDSVILSLDGYEVKAAYVERGSSLRLSRLDQETIATARATAARFWPKLSLAYPVLCYECIYVGEFHRGVLTLPDEIAQFLTAIECPTVYVGVFADDPCPRIYPAPIWVDCAAAKHPLYPKPATRQDDDFELLTGTSVTVYESRYLRFPLSLIADIEKHMLTQQFAPRQVLDLQHYDHDQNPISFDPHGFMKVVFL